MSALVLGMANELLAFNYREAFVNAFEVCSCSIGRWCGLWVQMDMPAVTPSNMWLLHVRVLFVCFLDRSQVSNKVVEQLMVRSGIDVCCTTGGSSDAQSCGSSSSVDGSTQAP